MNSIRNSVQLKNFVNNLNFRTLVGFIGISLFLVYIGLVQGEGNNPLNLTFIVVISLLVSSINYWFNESSQAVGIVWLKQTDAKFFDSIIVGSVAGSIIALTQLSSSSSIELTFLSSAITSLTVIMIIISSCTLFLIVFRLINIWLGKILLLLIVLIGSNFSQLLELINRSLFEGNINSQLLVLLFSTSLTILSILTFRLTRNYFPPKEFRTYGNWLSWRTALPSFSGFGSVMIAFWLRIVRSRSILSSILIILLLTYFDRNITNYNYPEALLLFSLSFLVFLVVNAEGRIAVEYLKKFQFLPMTVPGTLYSLYWSGLIAIVAISFLLSLIGNYSTEIVVSSITVYGLVYLIFYGFINNLFSKKNYIDRIFISILILLVVSILFITVLQLTILTQIILLLLATVAITYSLSFKSQV